MLIHGWGLHAIVFDDIVPALLERFRVTVVDLPGMGPVSYTHLTLPTKA